jgi:pimeloyl-ACP methyl ester carboxylesterase
MAGDMNSIREQVFAVGPFKSLVAAVAEPARSGGSLPGVIILNSGIIHRVGHQRKFVALARELARKGHTTVRFDFSGIGDSDAREDSLPPLEACMADIREVLDWLESTRQLKRFVLVGLCSGADHAVFYGGSDSRVVGVVLLDPSIPPTRRYYFHYFSRRLIRPSSWIKFLIGHGRLSKMIKMKLLRYLADDTIDSADLDDERVREFLRGVYARAVANKIEFLAVLTGAGDSRQSYGEQIFDAFPDLPLRSLLRAEFLEECDHLFLFESDRKRLNSIILNWIDTTRFRGTSSSSGSSLTYVMTMLPSVVHFVALAAG